MKMSGQESIPAPREQVWKALNDPAILKQSITGCKELEKTSDTEFSAVVQAKVGPVKATFNGDVKLSNLKAPESYVLSGQGKGGVAGFAKGKATVKLEEADGGAATLLSYDVDAQVGGKLAQIGSRLISSTAKKMANDFFKKFAKLAAGDAPSKPAKKPVKKKTATKKAAIKKVATKKQPAKAAPAKEVAPEKTAPQGLTSAKVAEEKPEIQRPQENPFLLYFLWGLGIAIIMLFLVLYGGCVCVLFLPETNLAPAAFSWQGFHLQ